MCQCQRARVGTPEKPVRDNPEKPARGFSGFLGMGFSGFSGFSGFLTFLVFFDKFYKKKLQKLHDFSFNFIRFGRFRCQNELKFCTDSEADTRLEILTKF